MSLTKVASSMLASGGGAGGSSVGKNYISSYNNGTCNGDFETGNASGWNICSVASITNGVPSTLTLSGSGITASVINSGQLAGQYSYQTVFSTTSALKGFCSDAFTIDLEDQAKVLTFKFYYNVTANATSGNFSGTSSNTFIVSIYDETTDTFIQPAGLYSMVQSSGSGVATGTFQTPLGSSQYRLVVLCANNPSANITVVWDDFFVGPQISVNAPAVSDWQTYTPTLTGFGTVVFQNFRSRRVGDSLEIQGYLQMGTGTAVNASFTLGYLGQNGNVNIDGNKITLNAVVGNVGYNQNSSTFFGAYVLALSVGNTLNFSQQTSTTNNLASPMLGSAFGAGSVIQLRATVPIAGWSSNSVASNDTDTRVVAARYITTSGSTGGRLQFNTIDFDTHAAVTTGSSWVYTAPVSGIYKIQAYLNVGANNIGTNSLILYVDNVPVQTIGNSGITGFSNTTTQGAASVKLNAGNTFYLAIGGTPVAISNAWITVERLSGPSVITATETVAASYCISAAAATAINVQFNFDSKIFDSHNAVTTGAGTWKFTAPVSGKYQVSSSIIHTITNNTMTIFKNGTIYRNMGYNITNAATGASIPGITIIQLNAGDYIDVRSGSNTVTPTAGLFSGATLSNSNFIDILRIGN